MTPPVPKSPRPLLPVSVLTGFLGSGKTTVLNHLVQQPEMRRTLVIVNEFGEIGLDHDLFKHSTDDAVIEMASGCICCTFRADLAKVLREAPGRFARGGELWFDRVVIETTGLADPSPILHTLMTEPAVTRRYRLDGVIATVDAANGAATLDTQIESVKQVAMADRLLLTKSDITDAAELATLEARLTTLNPGAPQFRVDHGAVDPALLFDAGLYNPKTKQADVQRWLNAEAYEHHGHESRHDAEIRSHCLTLDEPLSSAQLESWLEVLMLARGEHLLRVKGIVNVAELDGPMVIHGVQHIFHPPAMLPEWPSDDRRSRIVFITRDIDETLLRSTLSWFTDPSNAHAVSSSGQFLAGAAGESLKTPA